MVDHAVLQALDDAAEVVGLEDEHPVVVEQPGNAAGDIVDFRNVGVDVVGGDQLRGAVFGTDLFGDGIAEEGVDDGDPRIVDGADDVGRGVDTDDLAHAVVGDRLEQDAVVAADFNGRCFRRIEEPWHDLVGIVDEMIAQRLDGR